MAQKAIGPTFAAELETAGLMGLPFSWDDAGDIVFGAAMTPEQTAAVAAVYAAHNPDAIPALTPDQVLAEKIAAGIAITCTGTPALNATYALDATTMDQIGSVARDAASGLGLPGGAASFTYPDASGQPRTFTSAQIVALYRAQRDLLFTLNSQAAILAHGGQPSWPASQAADIA